MAKRQYSDDEKAVALTYLEVNKGDVSKTARQTGVPRITLLHWRDGEGVHPNVFDIVQSKKGDLASRYDEKINLLVDAITVDKIAESPLVQITTAIGTLQDKAMALRGEASVITQNNMSDDERNLKIAELMLQARERILNES